MLKLKTVLFFLLTSYSLFSQKTSISGYVKDLNTGELVIGAYIIDTISKNVTQTNNYGFYSLKIGTSKAALLATYLGFKSKIAELNLKHDTLINIYIQPMLELEEVTVSSTRYENSVNVPLGLTTIPIKQLISIPALGEPDLIKSIQNQPGIKGGIEGSAGIFVRGGGPGENLYMLDDVPLYNISHLYGFFSTFNSSAIKDIKLLKGGFPAKYGGRVSAVVDVRSREGNNKSISGEVSLGFISSKLTLEGPLFNDKTTFIISGRRSFLDLYSNTLKKLGTLDESFPDYYFYDLNFKITHTFSQYDKIFLNIYNGKDRILNNNGSLMINNNTVLFSNDLNEKAGWGNIVCSLRWNHIFNNSLFVNTTFALSKFNYFSLAKFSDSSSDTSLNKIRETNYSSSYLSANSDITVKTDFEYTVSSRHKLTFGMGNTFRTYNPGKHSYSISDQVYNLKTDTSYNNKTIYASEPFIYLEDNTNIIPDLIINAGLRFTGLVAENNVDFNIEPRFSASYFLLPDLVFKTGYSRMVQYMHLLSTTGLTVPTDIWVPALEGLHSLKSDQINAAISFDLNKTVLFSIEVYQKWLTNTTDFSNGASLLVSFSPWYEITTQGYGNSKGVEISAEKHEGKLTGMINYTLSTADRKYSDLNNGKAFPFMYDRLHDFNVYLNYQIFKKWDISMLWIYGTGYPVTVPVEKYAPVLVSTSYPINYYPSINNCRLPAYHRLDIGIHYKTQNRLGDHILSFDVFNAYNRRNPINVYYAFNYLSFKYSYLLPIVPSVTYTLKFK
jgi:hypothetical protein